MGGGRKREQRPPGEGLRRESLVWIEGRGGHSHALLPGPAGLGNPNLAGLANKQPNIKLVHTPVSGDFCSSFARSA